MVVLLENFKSITDDDGKEIRFETADVTKSIVVEGIGGSEVRIDEGNYVTFVIDVSGEVKTGTVTKVAPKKIQIKPSESSCEEIWALEDIKERTLQIFKVDNESDE